MTVTYERIKISRIVQDDSITDPQNISGDINGTIIQQIRSKFRRCLAKKTADGQMTIRYLKNDNSNYYDDGSAAKLDGTEGDVMVYYPRFYYKYEDLGSGKFAYSFALVQLDLSLIHIYGNRLFPGNFSRTPKPNRIRSGKDTSSL